MKTTTTDAIRKMQAAADRFWGREGVASSAERAKAADAQPRTTTRDSKPVKTVRAMTHDRSLTLGDNRGYWMITKKRT